MLTKQKSFNDKLKALKAIVSGHRPIQSLSGSEHSVLRTDEGYKVDGKEMTLEEFKEWEKNKTSWDVLRDNKSNSPLPSWHDTTECLAIVQSHPKPLIEKVAEVIKSIVKPHKEPVKEEPIVTLQPLPTMGFGIDQLEEIPGKYSIPNSSPLWRSIYIA